MAVIGIDFGNLNCVIAQAGRGGVDVLLNGASKRQNANCVSLQGKERFMGDEASAISRSNYKNTGINLKRFIGRKYQEPEVQQEIAAMPGLTFVELPNGNVGLQLSYNDSQTVFTMEQLTAMMLTKIISIVEGGNSSVKVADSVVSIPSYFTDAQRQAMLNACSIANLHCLRLMHEGTACALAYGIFRNAKGQFDAEKPMNVLLLDLGQSAYQVTAVSFVTGKLTVRSSTYDRNLGGRDFDAVIAKHIAEAFKAKYGDDPWENPKARMKLFVSAEKAKKTLSPVGVTEAPLSVECLMNDMDFNGKLTLDEFKELSAPLLDRLAAPIQQCLAESGLAATDFDSVEIVGGSTRLGFVKSRFAEILGISNPEPPNYGLFTTMNADEAVARGTALQAAILSARFRVKDFSVIDAVSYPVLLSWDAVDAMDQDGAADDDDGEEAAADATGTSKILFNKNDETPKTRRIGFTGRSQPFNITATYDETAMSYLPPAVNTSICNITVQTPAPKDPAQVPKIRVNVKHDLNGILRAVKAEALEEIKAEEGEGKEDGKDAKAEASEAPEAKEGEGKEGAAEEPKKKRFRKVDVPVETSIAGMDDAALQDAISKELEMQAQDKVIVETAEARNDVEGYIYGMRDKLIDNLRPYCTDSEKEAAEKALTETEDWLYYGDGYDAEKTVYLEKLMDLRKHGNPIERREMESKTRENAVAELKKSIEFYKNWVNQSMSQEAYSHITDDDRNVVRSACTDDETWLFSELEAQGKLPLNVNPTLLTSTLSDRRRQLDDKCRPVTTKPKPAPKPVEKPPEAKGAEEDAKGEEGAKGDDDNSEAPPPPPEGEGAAEGTSNPDDPAAEPMDVEGKGGE